MNNQISSKLLHILSHEMKDEITKILESAGTECFQQFFHNLKNNIQGLKLLGLEKLANEILLHQTDKYALKDKLIKLKFNLNLYLNQKEEDVRIDELRNYLEEQLNLKSKIMGKLASPLIYQFDPKLKHALIPTTICYHLTHLITNSLDHGTECPGVRFSKGKPINVTIQVVISQENNQLVFQWIDDGKGHKNSRPNYFLDKKMSGLSKPSLFSGAGLGLWQLSSWVEKYKGQINLEAKENEFFKVKISLDLRFSKTQKNVA